MKTKAGHLTYCTNIHTGTHWTDHFRELKTYIPEIKKSVGPDEKMGVGLRVSCQMQLDLANEKTFQEFKSWLEENDLYVFTINGFPYGDFHSAVIKEKVHAPDWTTSDRLEYTLGLFDLLDRLLPEDLNEGGISTSPLSYRHWYRSATELNRAVRTATEQILKVADHLHHIHQRSGNILHLDIEPEPDGILEDGKEFIKWYTEQLLPQAHEYFTQKGLSIQETEALIRRHICLCYDVCHMAVEYEDQALLVNRLKKNEISIGKIQLSSAIKIPRGKSPEGLKAFVEDQYLHQAVLKTNSDNILKFKDLNEALESDYPEDAEWRVHYHVPVFTRDYNNLSSTRDYIQEILELHKNRSLTQHLEIETYTWEVLPEGLQLPLTQSIVREYEFILDEINKKA